jgi:hypothetical protein
MKTHDRFCLRCIGLVLRRMLSGVERAPERGMPLALRQCASRRIA